MQSGLQMIKFTGRWRKRVWLNIS